MDFLSPVDSNDTTQGYHFVTAPNQFWSDGSGDEEKSAGFLWLVFAVIAAVSAQMAIILSIINYWGSIPTYIGSICCCVISVIGAFAPLDSCDRKGEKNCNSCAHYSDADVSIMLMIIAIFPLLFATLLDNWYYSSIAAGQGSSQTRSETGSNTGRTTGRNTGSNTEANTGRSTRAPSRSNASAAPRSDRSRGDKDSKARKDRGRDRPDRYSHEWREEDQVGSDEIKVYRDGNDAVQISVPVSN